MATHSERQSSCLKIPWETSWWVGFLKWVPVFWEVTSTKMEVGSMVLKLLSPPSTVVALSWPSLQILPTTILFLGSDGRLISVGHYSILHQQFPLQLAYGVTLHHAQGCTVQKAVVCLGEKFFASGQALRTLNDLVLWEFHPSAVYLELFYRQLLQWWDNVDVICPTPSTGIVEHPQWTRDYFSNDPIPDPSTIRHGPYNLILIHQMLIHRVPQPDREGDVLVRIIHQAHPNRHNPSVAEGGRPLKS